MSHHITDDGRHRQYESEQVDGWSIFKESMLALLVLVELADGGAGGEDAGGDGRGGVGGEDAGGEGGGAVEEGGGR